MSNTTTDRKKLSALLSDAYFGFVESGKFYEELTEEEQNQAYKAYEILSRMMRKSEAVNQEKY